MSSFTKPLTVTKTEKGTWIVERSFKYHIGLENSKKFVDIRQGVETDFASVPRIFWIIFPPDGKYSQATVVHDDLYDKKECSLIEDGVVCKIPVTREEADLIFLEAMGVLNVPWWQRRPMYRAVRMFGWIPWNKGRRKN